MRTKTSAELLQLATDSALESNDKISTFISQLKAGEVLTRKTSDFRLRRLTCEKKIEQNKQQKMSTKEKSTRRHKRTSIFASSEIGMIREKSAPFPPTIMGTFSCHGIEPDYDDEDAVVAKTNQDRGCVVFPFNHQSTNDEVLFMVLDGHGEQGDRVSEFVMNQVGLTQRRSTFHDLCHAGGCFVGEAS